MTGWLHQRVAYLRRLKVYTCKLRGHKITHPLVITFQDNDRLNPDGSITKADQFTLRGTRCEVCD